MRATSISLLALLLLLTLQPISAQHGSSYLGCFSFSRMLYLKGVEGVKVSMCVVRNPMAGS